MRSKPALQLVYVFFVTLTSFHCLGHDTPIHEKLTQTAALFSTGLLDFLTEQLTPAQFPFQAGPKIVFDPGASPNIASVSGSSPIGWMKLKGSTQGSTHSLVHLLLDHGALNQ